MINLPNDCPEWYKPLLKPISDAFVCGESLEYDNAYILLMNELEPKIAAEFGEFVEVIEPLNFVKICNQAQELLKISIDIRLIIILLRCRLHLHGIEAIVEGIQALRFAIKQWPESIHPQLWDEGEYIPSMRTNAFSDLDSSGTIIKELRTKKIPLNLATQITIGDFEKVMLGVDSSSLTQQQLDDNRESWSGSSEFRTLQLAAEQLRCFKQELATDQSDVNPEFKELNSILMLFSSHRSRLSIETDNEEQLQIDETIMTDYQSPTASESTDNNEYPAHGKSTTTVKSNTANQGEITSRQTAVRQLQKVRQWFLNNEPSSPIINLLAFTEQLVGKNFLTVIRAIPPELIEKLELEGENHNVN